MDQSTTDYERKDIQTKGGENMEATPALVPILVILFAIFGLRNLIGFLEKIVSKLLWIAAIIAIVWTVLTILY